MNRRKQLLGSQRGRLLQRISKFSPWIEGTLVTTNRFCGRKNCACHTGGQKHPVMYVTWKENGKTVSLYVPKQLEAEVKSWVANYKKLKEVVRQISNIQKDIVRLREDR
jgi:hypothetical protein